MQSILTRCRGAVAVVLGAGAVGTAAATLFGCAGTLWWVLDLFSHFRVQYAAIAALAAIGCALLRHWRLAIVAAVSLGFNVVAIAPLYTHDAIAADRILTVLTFNVHDRNDRHGDIVDALRVADADLCVVLEVTDELSTTIASSFPNHTWLAEPRSDSFGIGVLSRRPIVRHEIRDLGNGVPAIELTVQSEGEQVAVLAVHTLPPVSSEYAARRDEMLLEVATWARRQSGHMVVLGDLNATPWSSSFRTMMSESPLVNSQIGFGVHASWPRGLGALSIPIDHCLHSPTLVTLDRSLGPFVGSDHRAVRVVLGVPVAP